MNVKLTPEQVAALTKTHAQLKQLLEFAESDMKSAAVNLISQRMLKSAAGGHGTMFAAAWVAMKGTPHYSILKDCMPVLLHLGGTKPSSLEGSKNLLQKWALQDLTEEQRWRKSVDKLRVIVASLEPPAEDSAEKQTIDQTIDQTISAPEQTNVGQNSGTKKKPWNSLADDLKKRWFAEMRKRKQWIPRKQFITDFLASSDGTRDKWKGLKANTEDRRFQDNKSKWEADAEAMKTQFKNRR